MDKELPMAIAPDGQVIQLFVGTQMTAACQRCYMAKLYCNEHKGWATAELLGVYCEDYDIDDGDRTLCAYWIPVETNK